MSNYSGKKRDPNKVPIHMRMDERRRNDNIDANKPLCEHCDGTGNQLLSMYQKCEKCDGTGVERRVSIITMRDNRYKVSIKKS